MDITSILRLPAAYWVLSTVDEAVYHSVLEWDVFVHLIGRERTGEREKERERKGEQQCSMQMAYKK